MRFPILLFATVFIYLLFRDQPHPINSTVHTPYERLQFTPDTRRFLNLVFRVNSLACLAYITLHLVSNLTTRLVQSSAGVEVDTSTEYLGCPEAADQIPQVLKQHRAILSLLRDRNYNPYSDYNCLFRAIVLGQAKVKNRQDLPVDLDQQAMRLRQRFLAYKNGSQFLRRNGGFHGVRFEDLASVERLFGVELRVFALKDETAIPNRGGARRHREDSNADGLIDLEAGEVSEIDAHSEVDFDELADARGEELGSDTGSIQSEEDLDDSFISMEDADEIHDPLDAAATGEVTTTPTHQRTSTPISGSVSRYANCDSPTYQSDDITQRLSPIMDGSSSQSENVEDMSTSGIASEGLTESHIAPDIEVEPVEPTFFIKRLPTLLSPRGIPIDIVWSHNHAMYVTSAAKLVSQIACTRCTAVFTRPDNLQRHLKSGICDKPIRKVYTKHGYQPKPTLFEQLQQCFPTQILFEGVDSIQDLNTTPNPDAIRLTHSDRFPTDVCVFDIESYAQPAGQQDPLKKTQHLNTQVPYYIGVAHKFDGFDINPDQALQQDFGDTRTRYAAFTHEDPQTLTDNFVNRLCEIQQEFEENRRQRYGPLLEFVNQQLKLAEAALSAMKKPGNHGFAHYKSLETEAVQLLHESAVIQKSGGDATRLTTINSRLDDIKSEIEMGHVLHAKKAVLAGKVKQIQNLVSKLEKFVTNLPITGFNSGRYDLNCLKALLLPAFHKRRLLDLKSTKIILKGTQILLLSIDRFNFFDITNFVAPGTTYAKFLTSMDVGLAKSVFPHNMVSCYEDLLTPRPSFPEIECFRSPLQGDRDIDLEVYEATKNVWDTRGFTRLLDLVEYYLKFDCIPFVTATEKYTRVWQRFGVNICSDGILTLPGLALLELFKHKEPTAHFAGIPEKFAWFVDALFNNIVGGPSCIFNRKQVAGETKVRPEGSGQTQTILGCDANSLYLNVLGGSMPVGTPIYIHPTEDMPDHYLNVCRAVRYPPNGDRPSELSEEVEQEDLRLLQEVRQVHEKTAFKREEVIPFARNEAIYGDMIHKRFQEEVKQQLEAAGVSDPVKIPKVQHILTGKQKSLLTITGSRVYVDAAIGDYVFGELNGCFHHFHNCEVGSNAFEKADVEGAKRLVESRWKTAIKQHFLQTIALKYSTSMYECDFKSEKQQPGSATNIVATAHDPDGSIRQTLTSTNRIQSGRTLEQRIRDGQLHGFVKCSVMIHHCDGAQRRRQDQLPVIFKNHMVSADNFDLPVRRQQMESILKKPRRVLVPSYYAEGRLFHTEYLRELLTKYGATITKIHYVLQYANANAFDPMVDAVWRGRVDAMERGDTALANAWKLLGNSCYGKTITAVHRQQNVRLASVKTVSKLVNSAAFSRCIPISDEFYEVRSNKRCIRYNLPVVIGCTVYNKAKLALLRFTYDFLDHFVAKEDYTLTSCDTDSIYFALATATIEAAVERKARRTANPQLLAEFHDPINGWRRYMVDPAAPRLEQMRPGLFKVEWSGTTFIGLMPKLGYHEYQRPDGSVATKVVARGAKKNQNVEVLRRDVFHDVLSGGGTKVVNNVNFRVYGDQVHMVREIRDCLADYLVKAVVQADNVSVLPFVNDFANPPQDTSADNRPSTPDEIVDRRLQAILTALQHDGSVSLGEDRIQPTSQVDSDLYPETPDILNDENQPGSSSGITRPGIVAWFGGRTNIREDDIDSDIVPTKRPRPTQPSCSTPHPTPTGRVGVPTQRNIPLQSSNPTTLTETASAFVAGLATLDDSLWSM